MERPTSDGHLIPSRYPFKSEKTASKPASDTNPVPGTTQISRSAYIEHESEKP